MLTKLWFKNFKNLETTQLDLKKQTVYFIYGENNQGKSNFLDAIMVASTGESVFSDDLDLICFNQIESILGIDFYKKKKKNRCYTKLHTTKKAIYQLNKTLIKNNLISQENVNITFISAEIIRIFQESPELRRKTLDQAITQIDQTYKKKYNRYISILKQRNHLLKSPLSVRKDFLAWNRPLIELSSNIIKLRRQYLKLFSDKIKTISIDVFSNKNETFEMKYKYKNIHIEQFNEKLYQELALEKLDQNFEKEKILGHTSLGAHKDDFECLLNHHPLFKHYSRGINRTYAFFFKLATAQLKQEKSQESAILCLDDVFCELDWKRKERLSNYIEKHFQIFYTSTIKEDEQLFKNIKCLEMKRGKITNAETK